MLNDGLETLGGKSKNDSRHIINCYNIFRDSGLEEITLPSTLEDIAYCELDCDCLRIIWLKQGC